LSWGQQKEKFTKNENKKCSSGSQDHKQKNGRKFGVDRNEKNLGWGRGREREIIFDEGRNGREEKIGRGKCELNREGENLILALWRAFR